MQIVMAFGLEDAIDEKRLLINTRYLFMLHRRSGSTIWYWYDEPIFPEKFATLAEFENTIIERFDKAFYKVHAQVKALRDKEEDPKKIR